MARLCCVSQPCLGLSPPTEEAGGDLTTRRKRPAMLSRRLICFMATSMAVAILPLPTSFAIPPLAPPVDLSETRAAKAERLRKLSQIPFVQLEIEFGNDGRLNYMGRSCYFDAVIRRSFKRSDLLPVGARVRVRAECKTGQQSQVVEVSPGVRVDLLSAPNVRDLVWGALLQMHLLPAYGPATGFHKIGAVVVLRALSDVPADDRAGAAHRASHLNDYDFLDENGPFGPGNPPQFPLNDVVVTYKDSGQPGRLFRAYYQGRTWRMRAEELGSSNPRVPAVINDAFAQTETWIWDQTRTYAVQMADYRTRFGTVVPYWKPIFEVQGADTIAGYNCKKYHVRSELPTLGTADVCMTSDGVVLRRSAPDGRRSEAVAVEYRPVSREQVTVPESYRKQEP